MLAAAFDEPDETALLFAPVDVDDDDAAAPDDDGDAALSDSESAAAMMSAGCTAPVESGAFW